MITIIHDATTGEIIEREMTVEEIAQFQADQVEAQKIKEMEEIKKAERQALLDKLGITADEAKLLLG